MNNPFLSLKDKNFRRYWQLISLSSLGNWIHNAALPWLAYAITDSPWMLGLVSAIQFLPVFLFSVFAGVVIDRYSKRKILLITQIGYVIISLLMALLLLSGQIRYSLVLVAAVIIGTLGAFAMPLKQATVSQLVEKEYLVNAVALYSISHNLCRIVGPALVGLLAARWNVGVCFALNTFVFFITLLLIFFVTLPPAPPKAAHISFYTVWLDIKEGFYYALSRRYIYEILFMMLVTGTFSINFNVLLTVISVDILRTGALGFGSLMSVLGVGSLTGAFWIALHSRGGPQKLFLYIAPIILAMLWLVISQGNSLVIYISLVLCGFFFISFTSSASAALQLRTEREYLGRVISLNMLVLGGTSPIGNLYSGALADVLGVRLGVLICGLTGLLCFAGYWLVQNNIAKKQGRRLQ